MKSVFMLLAVLASFNAVSQTPAQIKKVEETRQFLATTDFVYPYLDTPPGYPGGNEAWSKYVSSSSIIRDAIKLAKAKDIPAGKYTVVVSFFILPDGRIQNVKPQGKPVGYGLDEAAVKLIKGSGKWTPAHIEGKYTRSLVNIPVHYQINY